MIPRRGVFQGLAVLLTVAGVAPGLPGSGHADGLPAPSGEIVLTIDGAITATNSGASAAFDLAMLQAMPAKEIVTETPWTKGRHTFTGVALVDLMTRVGAHGTQIQATALDDYSSEVPLVDGERFGVIVAYLLDGKPMLASGQGPLWIMYPFSDMPETMTETYRIRAVWNLERLTVH